MGPAWDAFLQTSNASLLTNVLMKELASDMFYGKIRGSNRDNVMCFIEQYQSMMCRKKCLISAIFKSCLF